MLVACRNKQSSYDATLTYLFNGNDTAFGDSVRFDGLTLQESTELVDGIGGTTWEGSLVLSKLLEYALKGVSRESSLPKLHLIELGCGTGLCGMVTAHVLSSSKVSLTDRHCDLAQLNIENHLTLKSIRIGTDPVNRFCRKRKNVISNELQLDGLNLAGKACDIIAVDLPWETGKPDHRSSDDSNVAHSPSSLISSRGAPDVIVGAEITCLIKQQPLLAATIVALCESNPLTVVFLSFDGPPPDGGENDSKYEREFNKLMRSYKFIGSIVYTASISWAGDESESKQDSHNAPLYAYMRDETLQYKNDLNSLSLPVDHDTAQSFKPLPSKVIETEAKLDHPFNFPPTPPPNSAQDAELLKNTTTHHITAFYRPTAVHTCSRCHHQFFRTPALNPPTSCRSHSGYFVCRWHPAEVRLSVGRGDSLGYYGTGSEGYEAKFWDCCGSEDPSHPGCCYDRHVAY